MSLRSISKSFILAWFLCRIKYLRISPQKIQFDVSLDYFHFYNLLIVYHYYHCFTFYSFRKSCNHMPLFLCQVRIYVNYGKSTSVSEWFSIECRNTKVITLTNHKADKQYSEPIRTRNNYMKQSAGKRVRTSHGWFLAFDWIKKN